MTPNVDRRSYISAIAGAAAAPGVAGAASADGDRVITITGQGETAKYQLTVSDSIEKTKAFDATINSYDSINGTTVEGRTTHEADSFEFTGEITDLSVTAPVQITINDAPTETETQETSADIFTVKGKGDETAHYSFTVDSAVKSTDYNGTINDYDEVDGTEVSGRTTREADSYAVTGEISNFSADAPVETLLNGEPISFAATAEESEDEPEEDYDYGNVVNVVEAGADPDGNENILPVIEDAADDDTLLRFPSGEYHIDGTFRITDFEKFGMVGEDATIDVAPTGGYVFKLGTYQSPISDLRVEGFTADISSSNTGGRVFEMQADDSLQAGNITIDGKHDTSGKGPILAGLRSSSGEGVVENVDLSDGGEDVSGGHGGTGLLVSHYHEGSLTIRDVSVGPFPDNGIYCSSDEGEVHVEGGYVENTNVAGIRIDGNTGSITGTEFVYDENIPGFDGQRPVRLDGGDDLEVSDVDITMTIDQTEAVRVMSGAGSTLIEDSTFDLDSSVRDAISVVPGGGPVEVSNLNISGNSRYEVFEY